MGTGGASKIKDEQDINHLISQLQECVDYLYGESNIETPQFKSLGSSNFKFSIDGKNEYLFSISKIKE